MNYETIIVGAGPAGLQLGYFLQKGGHSYCILERGPAAATFFDRYPHSGKLISINKKHTGSDAYDFNLRHDWNSLLNDEKMSFTSYSDEYYPAKEDLVRYMNDFARRFKLNIKYNHTVTQIDKTIDGTYLIKIKDSEFVTCKRLVIATGISVPNYPNIIDNTIIKPKHYADYPKDFFRKAENLEQFRNKSLLIIGNGNSGFELGNLLTPYTSHIAIYGRRRKEWAAVSHYTGDFRSIYMPFLDTFLLKSLNGINWGSMPVGLDQDEQTKQYMFYYLCSPICNIKHKIFSLKGFDHIIYATGWKFDKSIFNFHLSMTSDMKFPLISRTYESIDNRNLFFIGSLMHSHDYKKGSGGFIHGFRYLIEYFYHINYDKKIDIDRFRGDDPSPVVEHILYKINHSSPMYQMYGQLGDTFLYDSSKNEFIYFNNVPESFTRFFISKYSNQKIFRIQLQYGDEPVEKIADIGIAVDNPANAQLLRPVLYVYQTRKNEIKKPNDEPYSVELNEKIYFQEDLFAIFNSNRTVTPKLYRAIKGYM